MADENPKTSKEVEAETNPWKGANHRGRRTETNGVDGVDACGLTPFHASVMALAVREPGRKIWVGQAGIGGTDYACAESSMRSAMHASSALASA